jgi:hypothetical protein
MLKDKQAGIVALTLETKQSYPYQVQKWQLQHVL